MTLALHSSYLAAVDAYLTGQRSGIEAFLANPNGDRIEKALIQTRMRIKAGDYAAANAVLDGITPHLPLHQGEKAFLRAMLLSFESRWEAAACAAQQALLQFTHCHYPRGLFITNYNLSVYFNRLGLEALADTYLGQAETFQVTANQRGLVLRARACAASKRENFDEALRHIEEALMLISQMDVVDQTGLESVAADIYFRAGHFDIARKLLERLVRSKVVRDKARVVFELAALRIHTLGQSAEFPASAPKSVSDAAEYALQWQILHALRTADSARARELWARLHQLLPQKFTSDFGAHNPSDNKSIFMTVARGLRAAHVPRSRRVSLAGLDGKPRQLVELLNSSPSYLRKEEIIERIWGIPYDASYDNRFYKLVNRIRKETPLKIAVIANTYRLLEAECLPSAGANVP